MIDYGRRAGKSYRADLKDGVCVSCGRQSVPLYRLCPYCGEQIWHPVWRRILTLYAVLLLPIFLIASCAIDKTAWSALSNSWQSMSYQCRVLIVLATGVLLLPHENKHLIFTSSRQRVLWLLNGLAASLILLLCALTVVLHLKFSVVDTLHQFSVAAIALSGVTVFFVLNCGWLQLMSTLLLTLLLLSC